MIEVKGLTKRYGELPVLEDVSFSVPDGQHLGLLGPKGAGNSTLLRLLAAFFPPSLGHAIVAGYDIEIDSREVRRRIGYLPQAQGLYGEMRVSDLLLTFCKLRGIVPTQWSARVAEALAVCGLAGHHHSIISRLPPHVRHRVGLAQAMVHQPPLVLLDEPLNGLEAGEREATLELIGKIGQGRTTVVASHILGDVTTTCQRVLVLSQGRLVGDTPASELGRVAQKFQRMEVRVVVRGAPGRVLARIKALSGVRSIRSEPTSSGQFRIWVDVSGPDQIEQIAKTIVGAKLGLLELTPTPSSGEEQLLDVGLLGASEGKS
ncbi:MAG TPA: ATP-binding cassette domain-containing protein [Candidatus Dormibacteraeota bacterium]|nr:ATP-binding cassette domain-containing protein [Candidatus Dormibacteraeota bacterium]